MVKKIIRFDMYIKTSEQTPTYSYVAKQKVMSNDKDSTQITFNLLDVSPDELSGSSASILLYMHDGSFFQSSDVTIDRNSVIYTMKEEETKHSGNAKVQIVLKKGTVQTASLIYNFEIEKGLEKYPITEVMIQDWTTLTEEAKAFVEQIEGFTLEQFVENKMGQELANLEVNYATRLTGLEQKDNQLTAQLADIAQQTNNRIDNIIVTPAEGITQQEIVDARQGNVSLGGNLLSLKENLKTILEPSGRDNDEYSLVDGRLGSKGENYPDVGFVRYNEYFGGHGANGVVRNTNTDEYTFDVVMYDMGNNFVKRDRFLTTNKYVIDSKYLFRVAVSRVDSADITESDKMKIHDAICISDKINIEGNISGNIDLGNTKNVKLENIVEKQRIIYPYPASSFHLEKVDGVAAYVKAYSIMVRNIRNDSSFDATKINELLPEYIADSPSGVKDCIRIPQKHSLVYDVPENTLKIVGWGKIEPTHDLLLLINHGDLFGMLADFARGKTLEDISGKINIEGNISGNISGNIDLGNEKNVKLENLADKQRIIYPYPKKSLVVEKVEGVAVYFYASNIMVRNHSSSISFNQGTIRNLLPDYVSDSPSGGKNYIRIPEKKSLVYDVPERTLKVVEWEKIETTQDLLLLSNHDDLMGVLADYWKWSILEDTSNKVESLTQDDPSVNIPSYWNSHINEKINQIRSNQLPLGKDGFTFGFITDIHYNPRNTSYNVSSPFIMSKIMEECDINLFVNGGDMGNQQNGEEGRKTILSDYYELMGLFKRAGIVDKMLPMLGNHESNTQNWSLGNGEFNNVVVHNDEVYSVLFRNTEKIPNINYGGDGTYYYVDDFANQIRHICLNTNDVEYTESRKIDFAIKQQQFDWLINEALEFPNADWSVVLATHIPPVTQDFGHRGMPVKNMEILKGIIKAFKDKSQFSDSENHSDNIYNTSVSVDFTDNENEFIVWIAGHHHRDHVTLVDNSYTVVLTADDGRRNSDNPIKTIGTDTEHVMDFFTVDKINKKVLITRVGAGEDREFTY